MSLRPGLCSCGSRSGAAAAFTALCFKLDCSGTCPHLQVHLRVPVGVEEDDDVGRVQVDAQAARARGQQEDELLAALRVEAVDLALPVLAARVACARARTPHGSTGLPHCWRVCSPHCRCRCWWLVKAPPAQRNGQNLECMPSVAAHLAASCMAAAQSRRMQPCSSAAQCRVAERGRAPSMRQYL